MVYPQYGIVGSFNRTLDQRALQDRNAFAVDLLFHQSCLKRLPVGANLLQMRDCIDRSAAEGRDLSLIIGRLRRSESYSKDRFHDHPIILQMEEPAA